MSATLDTAPIAHVLGEVPVISSEGRAYPVEVIYRPHTERFLSDAVVACIHVALREQSGSLLVFLPGAGEIHRVAEQLKERLPTDVLLAPLYGNLQSSEQDGAIQPAPPGQQDRAGHRDCRNQPDHRGGRVVIDSGQQRRALFNLTAA